MDNVVVTDRSRIECAFDCPRKRYWAYEYGGWGLSPEGPLGEDLAYGIAFHEGAETLARGGRLEDALQIADRSIAGIEGVTIDLLPKSEEYRALAYGHLRTLHEQILPSLRNDYDFFSIEEEMALPLSDNDGGPKVVDMTRLDIAFREKKTGDLYNVEWKTSSDPSKIREEMQYNLQFVLNAKALSLALGKPVVGTLIIGVDKGRKGWPSKVEQEKGLSGNRRESPFTYAYSHHDGWKREWRLEWTRGFKKIPIWSVLSVEEWYAHLTDIAPSVAREQFALPPPIMWNEEDYKRMARQVVGAESRVAAKSDLVRSLVGADAVTPALDEYFPMNRKNCLQDGGYRGHKCSFIPLCHEGKDSAPREWGFRWREANHPLEETVRVKPEEEDVNAEADPHSVAVQ